MTTITNDTGRLGPADAQVVDPRAVADLMLAFEQVCRVGIMYPPGHSLCEQAADFFRRAMARVVGKADNLSLELEGGVFRVQGVELDEEPRQSATVPALLEQLGIAQVLLDRDLSTADLYAFVARLFSQRNQVRSARRFHQLRITGMPAAVRVRQREFQSLREAEDDSGTEAVAGQTSIGTVISALARQGLDQHQLDTCRRLLEAVPERLEQWRQLEGGLPQVSWTDVEKLLLRAARQSGRQSADVEPRHTSGPSALDTLTAVFRGIGSGQDASQHREAIDLLLSLNRRDPAVATEAKPEDAPATPARPRQEHAAAAAGPSAAELVTEIERYAREAAPPANLPVGDPVEQLSILMLLLGRDQQLPVQVRIEKTLRQLFAGPLPPEMKQILVAGLRQLLAAGERERFAGAAVLITSALRDSAADSVLALLLEIARDQEPEPLAELWPFLVNEILMTRQPRQSVHFAAACELAAALPDESVARVLPELEHLEALRDQRVLSDVFLSPSPALRRIFVRLLDTGQAAFVGRQLILGLRRSPLGWLDAAVLPLIETFAPRHRELLTGLLRLGGDDPPPRELLAVAGRLVTETLPVLAPRRRNEAWVPATIAAVPRLRLARGQEILRRIDREKQLLVLPAWPRPCREAAQAALRMIALTYGSPEVHP